MDPIFARFMPHTLTARIEDVICLAVCLFALWQGRRDQRIVALVSIAALLLMPLVQDRQNYEDPHGRLFWVDGPETVILVGLALRSGTAWLIIVAALQLLCLTTELAHAFAHQIIGARALITLYVVWTMALHLVLFLATLEAMRRTKAEKAARWA